MGQDKIFRYTFSFYLNGEQEASLNIYDTMGRKIKTVWEGSIEIGEHRIEANRCIVISICSRVLGIASQRCIRKGMIRLCSIGAIII